MQPTERNSLQEQWQAVANALGIQLTQNARVRGADGRTHEFALLLPQFGGSLGMLVAVEHDLDATAAASDAGYGYSSMSAETHYLPIDPLNYIDCLLDWGWSAKDPPPRWYQEALAREMEEQEEAVDSLHLPPRHGA